MIQIKNKKPCGAGGVARPRRQIGSTGVIGDNGVIGSTGAIGAGGILLTPP